MNRNREERRLNGFYNSVVQLAKYFAISLLVSVQRYGAMLGINRRI